MPNIRLLQMIYFLDRWSVLSITASETTRYVQLSWQGSRIYSRSCPRFHPENGEDTCTVLLGFDFRGLIEASGASSALITVPRRRTGPRLRRPRGDFNLRDIEPLRLHYLNTAGTICLPVYDVCRKHLSSHLTFPSRALCTRHKTSQISISGCLSMSWTLISRASY